MTVHANYQISLLKKPTLPKKKFLIHAEKRNKIVDLEQKCPALKYQISQGRNYFSEKVIENRL